MTDRKQRVVVRGTLSSWSCVTSGVPQGTILGPIIFLIYVNDISSTFRMFADDTKVYRELSNIGRDTEALQLDVDELLSKWQLRFMLHSLCILQGGGGRGGADDFRGRVLKFLEQKRGGYENRLNISWGDAYFL